MKENKVSKKALLIKTVFGLYCLATDAFILRNVYLHLGMNTMNDFLTHTVYLCLGTNLGEKKTNLNVAIDWINLWCGSVKHASGIYKSAAWGYESMNEFYNQCLEIKTELNPELLLEKLLLIENNMGRDRISDSYIDRIIDIDILLYEDLLMVTDKLILPHPRMAARRFVLAPMVDLAPDLLHPVLGKTMERLLKECMDEGIVERV